MVQRAAAITKQHGIAAASAEELDVAFDLLSSACKLSLASSSMASPLPAHARSGNSSSQLLMTLQAACGIAHKLLEQQPGRTALLDECSQLQDMARQEMRASAAAQGEEDTWPTSAAALQLLKLEFATATYARDQQQQKALLQGIVQHPLVTVCLLTSCGQLCNAAGRLWTNTSVACIAFGLSLRIAMQAKLQPDHLQAAAEAINSLLKGTSSNAVRIKVCERAVQLMAQQQKQDQQYPASQLRWLYSTCWNHAVTALEQDDFNSSVKYGQLAVQMLKHQPGDSAQQVQALMQQRVEQLQQQVKAASVKQQHAQPSRPPGKDPPAKDSPASEAPLAVASEPAAAEPHAGNERTASAPAAAADAPGSQADARNPAGTQPGPAMVQPEEAEECTAAANGAAAEEVPAAIGGSSSEQPEAMHPAQECAAHAEPDLEGLEDASSEQMAAPGCAAAVAEMEAAPAAATGWESADEQDPEAEPAAAGGPADADAVAADMDISSPRLAAAAAPACGGGLLGLADARQVCDTSGSAAAPLAAHVAQQADEEPAMEVTMAAAGAPAGHGMAQEFCVRAGSQTAAGGGRNAAAQQTSIHELPSSTSEQQEQSQPHTALPTAAPAASVQQPADTLMGQAPTGTQLPDGISLQPGSECQRPDVAPPAEAEAPGAQPPDASKQQVAMDEDSFQPDGPPVGSQLAAEPTLAAQPDGCVAPASGATEHSMEVPADVQAPGAQEVSQTAALAAADDTGAAGVSLPAAGAVPISSDISNSTSAALSPVATTAGPAGAAALAAEPPILPATELASSRAAHAGAGGHRGPWPASPGAVVIQPLAAAVPEEVAVTANAEPLDDDIMELEIEEDRSQPAPFLQALRGKLLAAANPAWWLHAMGLGTSSTSGSKDAGDACEQQDHVPPGWEALQQALQQQHEQQEEEVDVPATQPVVEDVAQQNLCEDHCADMAPTQPVSEHPSDSHQMHAACKGWAGMQQDGAQRDPAKAEPTATLRSAALGPQMLVQVPAGLIARQPAMLQPQQQAQKKLKQPFKPPRPAAMVAAAGGLAGPMGQPKPKRKLRHSSGALARLPRSGAEDDPIEEAPHAAASGPSNKKMRSGGARCIQPGMAVVVRRHVIMSESESDE